jgi:hypothetical protein
MAAAELFPVLQTSQSCAAHFLLGRGQGETRSDRTG